MMGNKAKLELGNHRISQEIDELNLNKTSLSGQHAEGSRNISMSSETKMWQNFGSFPSDCKAAADSQEEKSIAYIK